MKPPHKALRMAHRSARQQGMFGFLSAEGSVPEAVGTVFRKERVRLWGQAVDLWAQRCSVLWAWGAGRGTWLVSVWEYAGAAWHSESTPRKHLLSAQCLTFLPRTLGYLDSAGDPFCRLENSGDPISSRGGH